MFLDPSRTRQFSITLHSVDPLLANTLLPLMCRRMLLLNWNKVNRKFKDCSHCSWRKTWNWMNWKQRWKKWPIKWVEAWYALCLYVYKHICTYAHVYIRLINNILFIIEDVWIGETKEKCWKKRARCIPTAWEGINIFTCHICLRVAISLHPLFALQMSLFGSITKEQIEKSNESVSNVASKIASGMELEVSRDVLLLI